MIPYMMPKDFSKVIHANSNFVTQVGKIQTCKRFSFERMLFIRTKHNMRIFRYAPLLSYKMTLKQQLNGEKLQKLR